MAFGKSKVVKKEVEPIEEVEEEEVEEKTTEGNERYEVVKELPFQPVREVLDKDGTTIHLITIEEALTEIMNT